MKNYCFLILAFILVSCNEKEVLKPSSLTELEYPHGTGSSGEVTTGLLGYGYDAKGFCDTISVRAKVIDITLIEDYNIIHNRPLAGYSSLVSGNSFMDMTNKFWNYYLADNDSLALVQHLRSLLKLAYNTPVPKSGYAFVYYSANVIQTHDKFYSSSSELPLLITTEFKNDIASLSTEDLVSKYGTHVLTDFFSGTMLEVLYSGDFGGYVDEDDLQQAFLKRMRQFLGTAPYILTETNTTDTDPSDEKLIYNTIGSKLKICGLINATDYNPDNIYVNAIEPFGNNLKAQFVKIGKDGLVPLYELVSDPLKKQELKTYINTYLITGLPL